MALFLLTILSLNPSETTVNEFILEKTVSPPDSFIENFYELKKANSRIQDLKNSDNFSKLKKDEIIVIDNYLNSYKKKIKNIKFNKEDYFLNGQDLLKISKSMLYNFSYVIPFPKYISSLSFWRINSQ